MICNQLLAFARLLHPPSVALKMDTPLRCGAIRSILDREPGISTRCAVERSPQGIHWQCMDSRYLCMYHPLASFNTRQPPERTCTNGQAA